MNTLALEQDQFDVKQPELWRAARSWAERECSPFDQAVQQRPQESGPSIWDMPAIDSKRVVSLLVELEQVIGCKLPTSLIKAGGYASPDQLIADLFVRIRQHCVIGKRLNSGAAQGDSISVSAITSRTS